MLISIFKSDALNGIMNTAYTDWCWRDSLSIFFSLFYLGLIWFLFIRKKKKKNCYALDINIVQEKADEALRKQTEIVAKSKNIAIEKEKIEMTIIEALQPLKAAKLALIEFKRDTIVDILEMESPPEDVEVVAECFFILRGIRDISWKNVRGIMLEEDYFRSLSEINCDLISLKQLSQCKGHLKVSYVNVNFCQLNDLFRQILY